MRCNYIREKKYQCGDDYMAVGVFSIIPQEHRGRGKKRKESSEGQKAKNKMDSLRKRQRKALTNFSPAGMFLTGTYEDPFLPEDILACRRDVENYKRRVMAATCKRFGAGRANTARWATSTATRSGCGWKRPTCARTLSRPQTMADGAGNSCGPPAGKSRTMPSGGSSGFQAGRWKSASCWSPAGCMRARSGKEPAGNGWNRNAM